MSRKFDQRVAVLVDIQNMFHSVRANFNGKLNYDKLLSGLVDDRKLVHALAYLIQRPDVNQDGFHDALHRFGYTLRIKDAKSRVNSEGRTLVRGSYEVMLTIDAMQLASKVDTIVLVTGDGNYAPLVNTLCAMGVRVEIAGIEDSTSNELIDNADYFMEIDKAWIIESQTRKTEQSVPRRTDTILQRPPEVVPADEEDTPQPVSNASRLGAFA
jgi:uncharacterized LabA/DUF88 family protein